MTVFAFSVFSNTPSSNVFAVSATLPISQFGIKVLKHIQSVDQSLVSISEDLGMVTFHGPVAIVTSTASLWFGKLLFTVAAGFLTKYTILKKNKEDSNLSTIGGVFVAAVVFGAFHYSFPKEVGIYFRHHRFPLVMKG